MEKEIVLLPLCVCLDVSSNNTDPDYIQKLSSAVETFYKSAMNHRILNGNIDIAVITFASDIKVEEDFTMVKDKKKPQLAIRSGKQNLNDAIRKGLEFLKKRKERYRECGIDYYNAHLFVFLGKDAPKLDKGLAKEIHDLIMNHKLSSFCIPMDKSIEEEQLNDISPRYCCFKHELENKEFVTDLAFPEDDITPDFSSDEPISKDYSKDLLDL